ncbi:hypothetical protein [Ottowia sp.]|uniref:hypothetical protein n=1 Tax=Ottowia sp. TaxID=1898956 RepID=UPI003A85A61A
MRAIELFRLRRVRDKPRALDLMQQHAGLTADQAQAALYVAVGGGRPQLTLPDDAAARACITALAGAGFVARFAAAPDFDAAERAQTALAQVLPHLPPDVCHAIGAWLLEDAWEPALLYGLQHLRMHVPAHHPGRVLLTRVAVETGWVAGGPGRA